jgi:hypothetical protein
MQEMVQTSGDPAGALTLPERVFAIIKEADSQDLGKHNIYRRKFNRVSLSDLEKEANIQTAGPMLMQFMAGLPKGDWFWQRMVRDVLFASYSNLPTLANPILHNIDLADRLVELQNWFYERLILPVMDGSQDERTDAHIATALKNIELSVIPLLLVKSHDTSARMPYLLRSLQPDLSLTDVIPMFPLHAFSQGVYGFDPTDTTIDFNTVYQAGYYEAQHLQQQKITESLQNRFPQLPRVAQWIDKILDQQRSYFNVQVIKALEGNEFLTIDINSEKYFSIEKARKRMQESLVPLPSAHSCSSCLP